MTTFKVLSAGPLTTFQDQGRIGQHSLGLTEGGAMDNRSFAIANRLTNNPINTTALEITLGGLKLECLQPATVTLTGAFSPLLINGKAKALWKTHQLKAGDRIEIGYAALGVRSYLAVSGGFQSDTWFNSASTVVREGIGQPLKSGDLLTTYQGQAAIGHINYLAQPNLRKQLELRFVAGYQWQQIPPAQRQLFLSSRFAVSSQNNRMGYQLDGPTLNSGIEAIYSEGISRGTIQLTGEGKPIVLMSDRQTIGGYPKLGSVITSDLDKLAQLTTGAEVSFKTISAAQAITHYRVYVHEIETLEIERQ